jgi:lipopolysaccharide/colanic/teichoic acid biosynthesis glycosyltransferase
LFFRQWRSGLQNRPFQILKFRTMHCENDDPTRQAGKNDARVYAFGRFLRRTSLDEFPQFINVLMGDMSLVGPRPHMVEHNEKFEKILQSYNVRSLVKPGITGLAQIRGYRGEARTDDDIRSRVECDIEYIERYSLFLDIYILLRTGLQVLLPPKSAY